MLHIYKINNETQIANSAIEAVKRHHRLVYPGITKQNPNRFSFQVINENLSQTVVKVVDTEGVKIMPSTAIRFIYATKIN